MKKRHGVRFSWGLLIGVSLALLGFVPQAMAQLKPGDILVADYEAGPNGAGYLFVIEPNGTRTVQSDFGDPDQGPTGARPLGVAVFNMGDTGILVCEGDFDEDRDVDGLELAEYTGFF